MKLASDVWTALHADEKEVVLKEAVRGNHQHLARPDYVKSAEESAARYAIGELASDTKTRIEARWAAELARLAAAKRRTIRPTLAFEPAGRKP